MQDPVWLPRSYPLKAGSGWGALSCGLIMMSVLGSLLNWSLRDVERQVHGAARWQKIEPCQLPPEGVWKQLTQLPPFLPVPHPSKPSDDTADLNDTFSFLRDLQAEAPSWSMPGFLTYGRYEIRSVCCFKPPTFWSYFVILQEMMTIVLFITFDLLKCIIIYTWVVAWVYILCHLAITNFILAKKKKWTSDLKTFLQRNWRSELMLIIQRN